MKKVLNKNDTATTIILRTKLLSFDILNRKNIVVALKIVSYNCCVGNTMVPLFQCSILCISFKSLITKFISLVVHTPNLMKWSFFRWWCSFNTFSCPLHCDRVWNRISLWKDTAPASIWAYKNCSPRPPWEFGESCIRPTQVYAIKINCSSKRADQNQSNI